MNAADAALHRSETALGPIARAGERTLSRLNVSFEFSPPRTPESEESLWAAIRRLAPLGPDLRLGDLRRRRLDA